MRTNNQRIYQAFEVLTPSLARYVARELRDRYSNDWWDRGVLEATGRTALCDMGWQTNPHAEVAEVTWFAQRCMSGRRASSRSVRR